MLQAMPRVMVQSPHRLFSEPCSEALSVQTSTPLDVVMGRVDASGSGCERKRKREREGERERRRGTESSVHKARNTKHCKAMVSGRASAVCGVSPVGEKPPVIAGFDIGIAKMLYANIVADSSRLHSEAKLVVWPCYKSMATAAKSEL